MKLFNTLTASKEHFQPRDPARVSMYVCGITPYDYAHMGHGRCYVTFDLLFRVLKSQGYAVTYCRNFTDIDDKILNRAAAQLGNAASYKEITNTFIPAYHEDMDRLACLRPEIEPYVTENIDTIITFIQGLIDKGKAYVVDGDVYYDIATFPGYGKLSRQKLDELVAGARVDVRDIKKSPLDFALWKGEKDGVSWPSPWGPGRPGWHIECSAMSKRYLGEQIDIHAGGADLIFPHHENEIAQTEGLTGKPFARYWLHNGFVMINKEKMSKSLGNFFTLREIFNKFDPMVIRFYILSHHYRAPIDFSFDDIASLQKSYQRLSTFFKNHPTDDITQADALSHPVVKRMFEFILDDLNTPGAWGVIFESQQSMTTDERMRAAVKYVIQHIFGLDLKPLPEAAQEITPEIQKLLDERSQARAAKDWKRADIIRDQLHALGYTVVDKK